MCILPLASVFLFGILFYRDYRFHKKVNERPAVKRAKAPVVAITGNGVEPTNSEYAKKFEEDYEPDKALFRIADHNFYLNSIAFAGSANIAFADFILSMHGY